MRLRPPADPSAPHPVDDESSSERASEPARRRPWRADGLVAALLVVGAFAARRDGLPRDGLWHDDAVTAAGAVKGSLSQLLATGVDHPTYTLGLRVWDRAIGYDALAFAVPAFIAGVLGPAALFLVLRHLGYERSISTLLAAALVVSDVHIVYSGRVRTYTTDLLVVLVLVVVVPRLAGVSWNWRIAGAWAAGGLLLGSVSAFALVATIVAGVILVLHRASDILLRAAVLALHSLVGLVFVRAVQSQYDEDEQAREWQEIWDAFLDFDPDPRVFAGAVLEHLERITAVFPGGPVDVDGGLIDLNTGWWSTAFVLVALAGLLWTAAGKRDAIPARFLLLAVAVGLVAGTLDRLPFGPSGTGARASLWLVPAMAVGLAAALKSLRQFVSRMGAFATPFDVFVYAAAAAVIVTSISRAPSYLHPGSESAAEFVDAQLGTRDAVFVLPGSMYAFALESELDSTMRDTPQDGIGFLPEFENPRVTVIDDHFGVNERSRPLPDLRDTDRVIVFSAWPGPISPASTALNLFDVLLPRRGFELERAVSFGDSTVWIWRRPG